MDGLMVRMPTCYLHIEGAAVAAMFVGRHKRHLSNIRTLYFKQLQRVLVIVWHRHLIHTWFTGQYRSLSVEKFDFKPW